MVRLPKVISPLHVFSSLAAATKWTTLTEFVKHLNSRPDCTIEETPKGWFIVYNPVDTEEALRRQLNSKRSRESADERQLEKVERHSFLHCHNSILGQVIKLQSAYTHNTTQMRDVKAPSEISGGNELKGFVLKVIVFVNLCSIILKDSHADEKYNSTKGAKMCLFKDLLSSDVADAGDRLTYQRKAGR
jgi:hypothetical protein